MLVYAISDLHLPGGNSKPMNVFGSQWDDHFERIRADWTSRVTDDDLVLLPGDLSWAMKLEESAPARTAAFSASSGRLLFSSAMASRTFASVLPGAFATAFSAWSSARLHFASFAEARDLRIHSSAVGSGPHAVSRKAAQTAAKQKNLIDLIVGNLLFFHPL